MEERKDDSSWLELRADFYNYLPILASPNNATTPCIPDKTLTPTPIIPRIPQKLQKPLPSRIPRLSPKHKPLPQSPQTLQSPQAPQSPQPPHLPLPLSPPPSPLQPRTYASVLAS